MSKELNFKKMLEKFDENGRSATCGKWSIGRGGYDLWWEIYYDGPCVLRCVDGEVEVETAFDMFSAGRKNVLLHRLMTWDKNLKFSTENSDVICKAKTYNITHCGGTCHVMRKAEYIIEQKTEDRSLFKNKVFSILTSKCNLSDDEAKLKFKDCMAYGKALVKPKSEQCPNAVWMETDCYRIKVAIG